MDVLGSAIRDFYSGSNGNWKLWVHNRYGRKEEMPVANYFRDYDQMSFMDKIALSDCRGQILDIGSAVGSHALVLQERGFRVTALDISPDAVKVIEERGVKNVLCEDVFSFKGKKFDTLLLLMNGIGLVQNIDGLHRFLDHAKTLLKKNGQIIFDSSDVDYLYSKKFQKPDHYYGEIEYQYAYRKLKTEWFSWLYIDKVTMKQLALEHGYDFQLLFEDDEDQYLAKLMLAA